MSLTATERQVVSVDVSLRVPRGEAGNLDSGVVDVLEAVDGVESVELERVTSVRPTWTDIHVDADVRVELCDECDVEDEQAVGEVLTDGFGVTGVDDRSVEPAGERRG